MKPTPLYGTVDIVVERTNYHHVNGDVLMIKRAYPPYQNKLALPGGFIDPEDETAEDAAVRELEEERKIIEGKIKALQ